MPKKKESKKMPATKTKMNSIDSILANISEECEATVSRFSQIATKKLPRISTGSAALDIAMGGGWACGRVHEIYGPEGGGKTTMTLAAIVQAQKLGPVAFVDMEQTLDFEWAAGHGVNVEDLIYSQPDSGEEALDVVRKLVESKKVKMIVLDSVAACVPQAEIDGEIGDSHVGRQARLFGQALRILVPEVAKTSTAVVFINQVRTKVGVFFGNPEVTPAGKALKFHASIRLDVRKDSDKKKQVLDRDGEMLGTGLNVKMVKNKTWLPFRKASVLLHYLTGIRQVEDVVQASQDVGLMKLGLGLSYLGTIKALQSDKERSVAELAAVLADVKLMDAFRAEVVEAGLSKARTREVKVKK